MIEEIYFIGDGHDGPLYYFSTYAKAREYLDWMIATNSDSYNMDRLWISSKDINPEIKEEK